MKFTNVKIIEGNECLKTGSVVINENSMLFEPIRDMHEIEDWERRLIKIGVKYVLAQVEVTLENPLRYSRGYVIFVPMNSFSSVFDNKDLTLVH